jgi:hypothetical protein
MEPKTIMAGVAAGIEIPVSALVNLTAETSHSRFHEADDVERERRKRPS